MFHKQALKRAPGNGAVAATGLYHAHQLARGRTYHSLDPQVCQILFARPTDEIVGGNHQMAQAMAQVIVETRKDRDTIGQTDDTRERELQEGCRWFDLRKQPVALGGKALRVGHRPRAHQPLEPASTDWRYRRLRPCLKRHEQSVARLIPLEAVGFWRS